MTITYVPDLDFLTAETQHVTTYPAGRTCAFNGCKTVLSRYNPSTFCAAHEPKPDWRYLGQQFGQ